MPDDGCLHQCMRYSVLRDCLLPARGMPWNSATQSSVPPKITDAMLK